MRYGAARNHSGGTKMQRKVMISCAVTGSADTPGKNPAVPVTPAQIAQSAVDAAKAGAAIVHIHVRDPQTTKPSMDVAHYREVVQRIRDSGTDVVINLTTGPGARFAPGAEDPLKIGPATNLKPAYRLAKAVLRGMMKARRGRIIQIGSVVGSSGNAGQVNYAAAKAALIGFTKSLAQEVGSRNITVNCVAPGFIDTDMTRDLPDTAREVLVGRIPLGRLGAPEDIAHAVAYLASPGAAYVTGITLHVNGGMYMV